jgi:hypothetical protein
MLSAHVRGFGATSLLQIVEEVQTQALRREASARSSSLGTLASLGALFRDYAAFVAGGLDATYVSPDGAVYCSKIKPQNYVQCKLNLAGEAGKAPIREMQRAVDRFINLVTARLQGRTLRGLVAREGVQREESFTIDNIINPIASETGYDGIVGPSTAKYVAYALNVAGILKRTDDPDVENGVAVTNVWAHPTRRDLMAAYAKEVATYLNQVADNFDALVAAYEQRGREPAQTPVDNPDTLPYVVPLAVKPSVKAPIITAAAAMVGLTTIAALSAAKKKPAFLYERLPSPAFGMPARRRRRDR